jgi:hypothetical protein
MNKLTKLTTVYDLDREEIRRRDAALPRLTVATLKILKSTFPESCRLRGPRHARFSRAWAEGILFDDAAVDAEMLLKPCALPQKRAAFSRP